jgi:hypothetical protein
MITFLRLVKKFTNNLKTKRNKQPSKAISSLQIPGNISQWLA